MDGERHFQRLKSKITVEILWPYILAIMEDGPVYAYEMQSSILDRFGFELGNVTSYMVLYKMESDGLVETEWKNVENRQRKYYSITKKGKSALKNAIQILEETSKKLKGKN